MVKTGIRFHGKLSRWLAKTMTARAMAGSQIDFIQAAGSVTVPKDK